MLAASYHDDAPVIVAGARTAIGKFGGALRDVDAHVLGSTAISAALERATVAGEDVDEVVMGQVGQVGADAYNARRCALGAGLPTHVTAMNVNRLCGSGLQAIVSAARSLALDEAGVVVAGGDENMSRQPFLDYGARSGWRLGARTLVDGTLSLVTDPFQGYPMGATAEAVAARYGVGRSEQDAFALQSQQRAADAIANGVFDEEIVAVDVGNGATFARDEHPRAGTTLESLQKLRPAFADGGSVTAGNSSGINDGAAAVVMMRQSEARRRGLVPTLKLLAWAVTGIDPEVMGYAPAQAIPAVLEKAGVAIDELDLIELNEAFAAQAVAVVRDVGLDADRVNVNGGAIALGHPVGATGAILAVKLQHALHRTGGRLGLISMCIGGGQGIAAVFERPLPSAPA
jgi:acetyl-CoA C-acetyltransferase